MSLPITMPDISKYYREERDLKQDYEAKQKAAYRAALEKQMNENNKKKEREEEYRKKYEIQMLQHYPPFGRRSDFSQNYDTVSLASNNVASLKDFDANAAQKTKTPKRYSSFDKESKFIEPREIINESKLSRENNEKPVFVATKGQEPYYPFGKPGNGAPMIDSAGHKQTRIAGNLWFNINGKTPEDRKERLDEYKQHQKNSLKNVTKYEPNVSASLSDESWILERKKAFLDQLDNINIERNTNDYRLKKQVDEYASLRSNANWFNNTFGKPGNGAPLYDPKRHNLNEVLESPRGYPGVNAYFSQNNSTSSKVPQITNVVYPKVKPQVSSSHRNTYDYVPPDKNSNIFSM